VQWDESASLAAVGLLVSSGAASAGCDAGEAIVKFSHVVAAKGDKIDSFGHGRTERRHEAFERRAANDRKAPPGSPQPTPPCQAGPVLLRSQGRAASPAGLIL